MVGHRPNQSAIQRRRALCAAGASVLVAVILGLFLNIGSAAAVPVDCTTNPGDPQCLLPLPQSGDAPVIPFPGQSPSDPPAAPAPTPPVQQPPGLQELCSAPEMQNQVICAPPVGLDPNVPSLIPQSLAVTPGASYSDSFQKGDSVISTMMGAGGADFSRFDIGYDPGSIVDTDKWDDRFFGMLTRLAFSAHTWLAGVCTWLIEQTVTFNIADFVMDPVNQLASTWKNLVVDQLGLANFAAICTAFVAGLLMLSGRLANGLVELLTSLVAGAIFVAILANPGSTLLGDNGLLGKTREFSLQAAAITITDNPNQKQPVGDQVAEPLIDGLGYALVVQPHMILDWGKSLDTGDGKCLTQYKFLVWSGPYGTDDKPRDYMRSFGCGDLADFNATAGPERLIGTVALGFGAFILIVLLALMAISCALAQVTLAGMVIASPFALVSAYLPRGGRNVLWWWCITVLSAALLVVFLIVGLAAYIRLIIGVFQSTNDVGLIMRFVVFDLLVLAGFALHRKIKRAAGSVASNLVRKLAQSTAGGSAYGMGGYGGGGFGGGFGGGYGGGGASMAPWAAGGAGLATGMAFRHLLFEGRQEFRSISRPVRRGMRYGQRTGRRMARTGPGRFVTGQVRAGRRRMVNVRKAAFSKAKGAGKQLSGKAGDGLHYGSIRGGLMIGAAGERAQAAAQRRGAAMRRYLNPELPDFPARPGSPGYNTPDGIVAPLPRRGRYGLRPGGGTRPSVGRSGGLAPRPEAAFPDFGVRQRLVRQLADKRAREAGASSPRRTSRLGIHHTSVEADRQLRNQQSRTTGHNTPWGSRAGADQHGRTGLRQPTGGGSAERRSRVRTRLNHPPNG